MKQTLGRLECVILQNKSGASLAQGDVVIVDGANAEAVTTTTTVGYTSGRVGVVLDVDGIANDAFGLIAFAGYVPKINLSGTGNIGDVVNTHSVAKQAVRHAAPFIQGDFAQVLGTSASPSALLFGVPVISGEAGTGIPVIEVLNYSPGTNRTTTSSSYEDFDGANAKVTIDKQSADTDILIEVFLPLYSTSSATVGRLGVLENVTDYDVCYLPITPANSWVSFSGKVKIAGLAAGSHTFRLRWKRVSGSGTLTHSSGAGTVCISAQEVSA